MFSIIVTSRVCVRVAHDRFLLAWLCGVVGKFDYLWKSRRDVLKQSAQASIKLFGRLNSPDLEAILFSN